MIQEKLAKDWKSEYFDWLKQKTTVKSLDEWTEITTPFLDRHNDGIVIYVRRFGDKIQISDDGYTLSDLEASGCPINSQNRKRVLHSFLNGFGVKLQNNELVIEANDTNFPQKKHFLIQAILSVNDMFLLSRNQVANIFIEDLVAFFDDNDIRYTQDLQLQGVSGFSHCVDFVIPKSKKSPERLVAAVNSPNVNSAKVELFNWSDIQPARSKDSMLYVFLNDNRKVAENIITAFSAYNTVPVLWSKRENYIDNLAI